MKRTVLCWSIVAVLAGAACSAAGITDAPRATDAPIAAALSGAKLIEFPTTTTQTTSALVTSLGGVVQVGGTSITVPAGALLQPTLLVVTIPASKYMEVDISVAGVEHFLFEQPVTITVNYSRCTRADIDKTSLSAWYIESTTKAPLENMGGVDDKVARTVTFTTPHLSGYALAN